MAAATLDAPPLVDLGDCEDIFVNGWSSVERLPGNVMRYTGYVQEKASGSQQRRVRVRVVVPLDAVILAIAETKLAISAASDAFISGLFPLN